MAPTEASILSDFLLPPAPLQTIITFNNFKELFPRAHQSNAQIPALYRELQHQRALDIDEVKRKIAAEVKRGQQQKRQVARARSRSEKAELDALNGGEAMEVHMENELFGASAATTMSKQHTLDTLVPALDEASTSIENDIEAMEKEAEDLLADMKDIVGDLSDLRYGKFGRPVAGGDDLSHEVVESLKRLQTVCKDAGNG